MPRREPTAAQLVREHEATADRVLAVVAFLRWQWGQGPKPSRQQRQLVRAVLAGLGVSSRPRRR